MVADDLAMQWPGATVAMVLTVFPQNILVSAPDRLIHTPLGEISKFADVVFKISV